MAGADWMGKGADRRGSERPAWAGNGTIRTAGAWAGMAWQVWQDGDGPDGDGIGGPGPGKARPARLGATGYGVALTSTARPAWYRAASPGRAWVGLASVARHVLNMARPDPERYGRRGKAEREVAWQGLERHGRRG